MNYRINNGDSIEKLKELEDNSVDSIVTDPPYELGFMGKSWDNSGIAYNSIIWKEALRVLKFGGHLLSFGGTRTYHRMAVAIEDAGFEIRDQIMWVYGSGFPKSHNIGKAVDKLQGNKRKNLGLSKYSQPAKSGHHAGLTDNNIKFEKNNERFTPKVTKGNSQWEGWGTALKPSHEPIVLARKPLSEKSIVLNVLKYGTGGINIDECRIEIDKNKETDSRVGTDKDNGTNMGFWQKDGLQKVSMYKEDRFPANFIHDGSDEVKELLGEANRFFYCPKAGKKERNIGLEEFEEKVISDRNPDVYSADVPNNRTANPKKNHHPTVKPIKLMQYLVRLITPKGGNVLDPFTGSGTTGMACMKEGFNFIGIEKEEEYCKIAEARIKGSIPAQKKLRDDPK